jgi:hypothetical protein
VIAVAFALALFIFFGAWAVSTDPEGRDRTFAFAVGGPGTTLFDQNNGDSAPVLGQTENGWETGFGQPSSNADTWWGKSLLKT